MILKTATSTFNIANNKRDKGVIWRSTNNNLEVINSNYLSNTLGNVFCNVTDTSQNYSDILVINMFNFNLRPNSTISGVVVQITATCDQTLLVKDSIITLNNKINRKQKPRWKSGLSTRVYGSSGDNWGIDSAADLNDLHLQLKVEYLNNSFGNFILHNIEVIVHYYEDIMYLDNRYRHQINYANDCTQVDNNGSWVIAPNMVYNNQFNDSYAEISLTDQWSNMLIFDNFGFSIPSYNSLVTGYSISIKGIYGGDISSYYLKINNAGTQISSPFLSRSTSFLTTNYINIGNDLDILGQTYPSKYVNTNSFSVYMKFNTTSSCNIKINSVYCTVYYKRLNNTCIPLLP